MFRLLLLGTSGCHLCEQAEAIINNYSQNHVDLIVESIDIAEHEQWQALYAIRIPVLYHPATSKDLGWPFDLMQVTQFMNELKQ